MGHSLTLISAPAGFGKTTLSSEWASNCGRPFAWISLDVCNNDPTCFLAYLLASLQSLRDGVAEIALDESAFAMLQSHRAFSIETFLINLINDIASLLKPVVPVLDDYHMIEVQAIHDVLNFLLKHLTSQMQLVVAGRSEAPLTIAVLRAEGRLIELREPYIRFTTEEITTFLVGGGLIHDALEFVHT